MDVVRLRFLEMAWEKEPSAKTAAYVAFLNDLYLIAQDGDALFRRSRPPYNPLLSNLAIISRFLSSLNQGGFIRPPPHKPQTKAALNEHAKYLKRLDGYLNNRSVKPY